MFSSGNTSAAVNKVTLHWARLVPGWVTDCLLPGKLSMLTEPGHPFMFMRKLNTCKSWDILTLFQIDLLFYQVSVFSYFLPAESNDWM